MNQVNHEPRPTTERDLKRLIEPLASYISAVDSPKAALAWALVILLQEVGQINKAAKAHVAAMSENHLG